MLPAGRQGCDASVRAMHASPQSEEKEPADGKRGPLGLTPPSRARGALLPWVAPTWRTLPCTRPLAARGGRLCRTLCVAVSGARRACRALRAPASPTRPRSFTDAVSCSAYPSVPLERTPLSTSPRPFAGPPLPPLQAAHLPEASTRERSVPAW